MDDIGARLTKPNLTFPEGQSNINGAADTNPDAAALCPLYICVTVGFSLLGSVGLL